MCAALHGLAGDNVRIAGGKLRDRPGLVGAEAGCRWSSVVRSWVTDAQKRLFTVVRDMFVKRELRSRGL
jgi:hypothetical protein